MRVVGDRRFFSLTPPINGGAAITSVNLNNYDISNWASLTPLAGAQAIADNTLGTYKIHGEATINANAMVVSLEFIHWTIFLGTLNSVQGGSWLVDGVETPMDDRVNTIAFYNGKVNAVVGFDFIFNGTPQDIDGTNGVFGFPTGAAANMFSDQISAWTLTLTRIA